MSSVPRALYKRPVFARLYRLGTNFQVMPMIHTFPMDYIKNIVF